MANEVGVGMTRIRTLATCMTMPCRIDALGWPKAYSVGPFQTLQGRGFDLPLPPSGGTYGTLTPTDGVCECFPEGADHESHVERP